MSDQPSLRLDAPREQVLAHAAGLIADAWRGFDQARPEQPEVDEMVRTLLRASLPPRSGERSPCHAGKMRENPPFGFEGALIFP